MLKIRTVNVLLHRALATSFLRPPRIAVVGSGPAGLYVCAGVLRRLPTCEIDVVESSKVPYGLIRYGVAPDHPEVKNCISKFDRMFTANANRLSLFCNVSVGKDVTFEELCQDYDAVVLAYGARRQRRLTIPGINACNVFSGGDLVSWYNAVPAVQQPLLDCKNAVVVGVGNVALDCSRILLSSGGERLSRTDMPMSVIQHLAASHIDHVSIVARRGPLDVSFTIKELREQVTLSGSSFCMHMSDIDADEVANAMHNTDLPRPRKRLTELMLRYKDKQQSEDRHCDLLFRRIPQEVLTDHTGRVRAVRMQNMHTGEQEDLECGLFIYSIGYENVVLPGVPQHNGAIMMKDSARVINDGNTLVYASGWCAHTPRGVIANTQADSANVSVALCTDVEFRGVHKQLNSCIKQRLDLKQVHYTTWQQWKLLDEKERLLGQQHGKTREKLTNFDIDTNNERESGIIP